MYWARGNSIRHQASTHTWQKALIWQRRDNDVHVTDRSIWATHREKCRRTFWADWVEERNKSTPMIKATWLFMCWSLYEQIIWLEVPDQIKKKKTEKNEKKGGSFSQGVLQSLFLFWDTASHEKLFKWSPQQVLIQSKFHAIMAQQCIACYQALRQWHSCWMACEHKGSILTSWSKLLFWNGRDVWWDTRTVWTARRVSQWSWQDGLTASD